MCVKKFLQRRDMMGRMDSLHQLEEEEQDSVDAVEQAESSHLLRNLGWVSAGITALAIGVVVGRELRERYKFVRRTPYEVYSHSGDQSTVEFGVGI
jgi:hypothetical protein